MTAEAPINEHGIERPRGGSGAMFDTIAARYDRLNRVISLGGDRRWRRALVDALVLRPGSKVLDLATGTAGVASLIVRRHPQTTVVGIDPSSQMLAVGQEKLSERGQSTSITLQQGVAENLSSCADASFDGVTIAFGIRNVTDRAAALREMARVTRADGRIAILELSEPRTGLLAPLARFHVHRVVPRIGAWLSGAPAYRYLERSIAAFPAPADFASLMAECNLEVLEVRPMTFGTVCLYVARPSHGGLR